MYETWIGEPVTVQARFLPGGRVHPTAFVWRERTRYVAGLGRQWTVEEEDAVWRCYLAQTPNGDTVELRWNSRTNEWRLERAWWRDSVT